MPITQQDVIDKLTARLAILQAWGDGNRAIVVDYIVVNGQTTTRGDYVVAFKEGNAVVSQFWYSEVGAQDERFQFRIALLVNVAALQARHEVAYLDEALDKQATDGREQAAHDMCHLRGHLGSKCRFIIHRQLTAHTKRVLRAVILVFAKEHTNSTKRRE